MDNKRMDYIDTLKGIGILFVVYAHVNYTPLPLMLIYSFHMPLFFIISGMLFRSDRYNNFAGFLRRRFVTLIVPYLIFSFAAMFYAFVSERVYPELHDFDRGEYIAYFLQILLAQGSHGVLNIPLWFVPCLFSVEIMYYFLSKLSVVVRIPLCMVFAAIGWLLESGLLGFDNTLLPWTIDSALYALSFYAFGNMVCPLVKNASDTIKNHRNKLLICIDLIFVSLVLWLPLALLNGKISLGSRVLGNGILLFMTGVFGSAALYGLSLLTENCPFLRFCGKNSFYIMATHYLIRNFMVRHLFALAGIPWYDRTDAVQTIVPFIFVLLVSLTLTALFSWIRKKK